jgi:hypothetical protein
VKWTLAGTCSPMWEVGPRQVMLCRSRVDHSQGKVRTQHSASSVQAELIAGRGFRRARDWKRETTREKLRKMTPVVTCSDLAPNVIAETRGDALDLDV